MIIKIQKLWCYTRTIQTTSMSTVHKFSTASGLQIMFCCPQRKIGKFILLDWCFISCSWTENYHTLIFWSFCLWMEVKSCWLLPAQLREKSCYMQMVIILWLCHTILEEFSNMSDKVSIARGDSMGGNLNHNVENQESSNGCTNLSAIKGNLCLYRAVCIVIDWGSTYWCFSWLCHHERCFQSSLWSNRHHDRLHK